jgi:HEAT repeat protein
VAQAASPAPELYPVILSPEEYSAASTQDLFGQLARGYVPLDARLLRVILERGEGLIPDCIQFLKEPRTDDRIDSEGVLLDIVRQLATPAALPFLAEFARVFEFAFSDELTEAFVELGAASVDTLLALYEESGRASDVAFALAGLGARDPRILEILVDLLKDDPADATIMLGLYGDPAAKPALEKALAEAATDETRREIETAIADIERGDASEPQPFEIFPRYPEEETPYFAAFDNPELLEFLKSPVADYRAQALRVLGYEVQPPEVIRAVLQLAESDPELEVRVSAWEALEAVHDPPEIEQALRRKLQDQTAPPPERAAALVALAHEADNDDTLRPLILQFYGDAATRAQAVKAMWHSGDRRFVTTIAKALDEPELEVRRQAITAAGVFNMVSQLGRLERFFEDEDLRQAALYAYALAAPSEPTPSRMRSLFHRIEDLAGGLDDQESMVVGKALDDRLEANEYDPIFLEGDALATDGEEGESEAEAVPAAAPAAKTGRNDPCPCGSGKKYKKCCGQ